MAREYFEGTFLFFSRFLVLGFEGSGHPVDARSGRWTLEVVRSGGVVGGMWGCMILHVGVTQQRKIARGAVKRRPLVG